LPTPNDATRVANVANNPTASSSQGRNAMTSLVRRSENSGKVMTISSKALKASFKVDHGAGLSSLSLANGDNVIDDYDAGKHSHLDSHRFSP
jgi:hypothetical protein